MLTNADVETLESMMDRSSVRDMLEALSQITYEKAQHIAENWQDKNTATVWERVAHILDSATCKVAAHAL